MSSDVGRGALSLAGTIIGSAIGGPIGGAIGSMAGSFLGQQIFPASRGQSMPRVADYPMQRAERGIPVPIEYGTCRMAGNIVWMGPTTTYTVQQGGKGGGGGGAEQTLYRKSFLISVCEGQRTVIRMWKGKHEVDISPSTISYGGKGGGGEARFTQEITVFEGDGVNDGLQELLGNDVLYAQYQHDCCVFFSNYDLGATDSIPLFTFEVSMPTVGGIWVASGRAVRLYDSDYILAYESLSGYPLSGNKTIDADNAGNVVFLHPTAPDMANELCYKSAEGILRVLEPSGGWVPSAVGGSYTIVCARFADRAGRAIYAAVNWRRNTGGPYPQEVSTIYKIDPALNEVIWQVTELPNVQYRRSGKFVVDATGNLYIITADGNNDNKILKYSASGTLLDTLVADTDINALDVWLDASYQILDGETLYTGFLFVGGRSAVSPYPATVAWVSLDGAYTDTVALGYASLGVFSVRTRGADIYACGYRTNYYESYFASLWKLDDDGSIVATWDRGDIGGFLDSLAFDTDGGLLVLDSSYDLIRVFDPDTLTQTTTYEGDLGFALETFRGELLSHTPSLVLDANPADIIWDLCTNTRYGTGMPTAYLDRNSFDEIWTYCQDHDLLISLYFNQAQPLLDALQHVCGYFGGFLYWMGGQLCLGAWKDDAAEVDITRDDLVYEDGPPVHVKKRQYSDRVNQIELTWQNREDLYGPAVAKTTDDVDIRRSGQRKKNNVELPGVKRSVLAEKLKWRYLIDGMYRFETYSFRVAWRKALIHPGQVVTLTDGFTIDHARCRIVSIMEAKDGRSLDVEAIDDVSDRYPDLLADGVDVTEGSGQPPLRTPDPTPVLADAVLTTREDWHERLLYLSLAPTGAQCNGWHLFISRDGNTYDYLGRAALNGLTAGDANSAGVLVTGLPAASAVTWRGDESVVVDIGTVTDLRTDITDADFFGNRRLAKIGNEIVAYQTCVEQATEGQWKITGLIRGLYQTRPVAHGPGEAFRTLDVNYIWPFRDSDVGRTVYFKALTFYGNLIQSLASATAQEVAVRGNYRRPYGAALRRLDADEMKGWLTRYDGDSATVYWNLCAKKSGFNVGPQDGDGTWAWGDSESELQAQSGVPWGSYVQDPELEDVELAFRKEDGTFLTQRGAGVVSSAEVTKPGDLQDNDPAQVEVWPRRTLRALRRGSLGVQQRT